MATKVCRLTIGPWLFIVLLAFLFCSTCAQAEVTREDNSQVARELGLPIYKWSDASRQSRGVIVALHGFIMHGGTYDKLARELVAQGFIVYAPDLRGYGRWSQRESVDYRASERDITSLAETLKKSHPSLPMFFLGESLGADMAIRLASRHPDLVNGLILSSPALKHYTVYVLPRMIEDCVRLTTNPGRQVDLVPYIKEAASEDPRISDEILSDPMVRKELTTREILKASNAIHATMSYVAAIPADKPVLVIQGKLDKTVKAKAVLLLLSRLKSHDQTVRWLPSRGHVLLETAYLQPSLLETIEGWLNQHVETTYQAANAIPQSSIHMN